MEENKVPEVNTEQENEVKEPEKVEEEQQLDPEAVKLQKTLQEAENTIVREVYQQINYEAMFASVGQQAKYKEFQDYRIAYEAELEKILKQYQADVDAAKSAEPAKEVPEPEVERPRPWGSFLDAEKPIVADDAAKIWDQLISFVVHMSIEIAERICGVVYDNVTGPQFINVQKAHEMFAGAIGELSRRVEHTEKALGIDPREQIANPPEKKGDAAPSNTITLPTANN